MVVYCCADLIFATKVRSTAESLGVTTRPVRDAAMLQKRLDRVDDGKCNDAMTGVLIDLDVPEGPDLIRQIKRSSPQVPVVAFGAHVATAVLDAARDAGADAVMARGAFTAQLPELLRRLGG
jgi:CheY-like chemotaxis protein